MRRPIRGFSLLEVMVALAIFGLIVSGILAAQAGLAASNKKAANMGQAVSLARCRMTETEEKLLKMGYSELDQIDMSLPCCDAVENDTFTCDTKVEKVVLPDPPASTLGGADGGTGPFSPAASGSTSGFFNPGANLDLDAGIQGIGNQLQAQTGAQGTAGMLNMVMGFVYPTMKPMMEASIRKITIIVHWKEGPKPQELTLAQYVTNPQRGGFISGVPPTGSTSPGGTPTPAPPAGGAAGGSPFGAPR